MSALHTGRGVFWYAVLGVLAPHRGSPHTIGPGLAGDGVPSYLHVREEPDPRHIPIMMKLWELTERMEVLQSSVRRCFQDFLYCRSHQCRAATVCCRLLTVPCWLHGVCARVCLGGQHLGGNGRGCSSITKQGSRARRHVSYERGRVNAGRRVSTDWGRLVA